MKKDGNLRCLYKQREVEKLDISRNEIYGLNFLKLFKFVKNYSQNLKCFYFKQIGQNFDDVMPSLEAKTKFMEHFENLEKWDFGKGVESVCSRKRQAQQYGRSKSKFELKSAKKRDVKHLEISLGNKGKSGMKNRRHRRTVSNLANARVEHKKSKVQRQKSQIMGRRGHSGLTRTPQPKRRKRTFKDITNCERNMGLTDCRASLGTNGFSTHRKRTPTKKIEFKQIRSNLKKFFKSKGTGKENRTPVKMSYTMKQESYQIEEFGFPSSPHRINKNSTLVSQSSSNIFSKTTDLSVTPEKIRESSLALMSKYKSPFDREIERIKSKFCLPKINIEELKEELVSPSIQFASHGISFGIQAAPESKQASEFKDNLNEDLKDFLTKP